MKRQATPVRDVMRRPYESIGVSALALVAGLFTTTLFGQQPTAARDFDAEIRSALQSAKTAAGFEFLGTLVRTCLLPQSGGENTSDVVPAFATNPAAAPALETWYAEPAKVFDNLYFVGGKIHSSWALTTSDGIILIDTIFTYNSEKLIVEGLQKLGLDPKNIKYILVSHAHTDHIGGAECCRHDMGRAWSWEAQTGIRSRNIRTVTRRWRRNGTSSRPTV